METATASKLTPTMFILAATTHISGTELHRLFTDKTTMEVNSEGKLTPDQITAFRNALDIKLHLPCNRPTKAKYEAMLRFLKDC